MRATDRATGTVFQSDFTPEEFAARRERIFDVIGPDSVALLQGAPAVRGFQVFRQSSEFYYCCGLEAPRAYLLLDGRDRSTCAFLPSRGNRPLADSFVAIEDAAEIAEALGLTELRSPAELEGCLVGAAAIYTPHSPAEGQCSSRDVLAYGDKLAREDPWDGAPTREEHLLSLLAARFPEAEVRDLTPVLDDLRRVKSPAEVELIRRASQLSALAVREAMKATRPGLAEYQLMAIARYVYYLYGARGEGYREILPSGANVWHGHYFLNHNLLREGDWVLMDCAPDYGYYTSDIGRIWPVSGTYAPWQRELYGFVVEYHKALLREIRPGRMADEIMDAVAAEMRPVVDSRVWSKPTYLDAARRFLDFRGHLSHPVGLAVHDVGPYTPYPLEPGVTFTVDPQLWVPEEGLYVRVEDTVTVTADGIEVLTADAPLELDDVEALMREESRLPMEL